MMVYDYSITRTPSYEVKDSHIAAPEEASAFLAPILRDLQQECIWAVFLNNRNHAIGCMEITRGLVDRCQCHARELFRPAIMANATKIIISHNHPSGDPTPSKADIELTKAMEKAGDLLGIRLVDHIIIGDDSGDASGHFSFREAGMMTTKG